MARTRSVFRHPRYYKPDHTVIADLSNAEANEVLMNILVRVKNKTFFCVQLRIDDHENKKIYYVGVNRRYENICVSYIHSAPMPQPLVAYMWAEDLQVKDLNLEAIRQALLRADDVNLRILGPPHRIPVRYEDLTAADDGNQDKAAINDASDLPWDLSRCVPNAVEIFHENNLLNEEKRPLGRHFRCVNGAGMGTYQKNMRQTGGMREKKKASHGLTRSCWNLDR